MRPVQLFCWHFMAYPYLPADFDEKYESGWVTVPNTLWDREKTDGLYQEYIDQLVYGEELGFDGLVLNEHHQNIYGLMPSPNIIAAALTQRTKKAKLVVLGNLLPLHLNPLRVAEEYAMIDSMSNGRLIAGFALGSGPEAWNYDVPQPQARDGLWEAIDLVVASWTRDGPFEHEGPRFPLRYVNLWPRPRQMPHPPVWIPGGRSRETMVEAARRGFDYFLSSRTHGDATRRASLEFAQVIGQFGGRYHPFRFGILLSVYIGETDEIARRESQEGIWYFLKYCLKGHLRKKGRSLTFGPGVPNTSVKSWEAYLRTSDPSADMLGDVRDWAELERAASIIVGSPETVRRKLWQLIEMAGAGNLLIQFHFGNMKPEHARKSARLFATEVAPYLRAESEKLFAREYPWLAETPRASAAE
ncbi:MAG: LLM class flavin-dependent oxidoreductase [Alphaproteobacteria bacterium]|nr:LLM class flavin-dependent oxidoreductase [Alphaproteobacteria bacterium]